MDPTAPQNTEIETEVEETETSLRDDIQASLAELTQEEPAETPERAATEAEPVEPELAPGRERDEKGRFAPKAKAAGPAGAAEPVAREKPLGAVPAAPGGAPVAAPAPVAEPVERAPQSWKPLVREQWPKLPPEVRQEILRREQDMSRTLQERSESHRGYQQFQEAIRPFEAMIRAEAGDPIRGIQALLGTAYSLRTGSPQDKARTLAGFIQHYGVDIDMLAAAIDGHPAPQQAQGPTFDPRVDQLYQRLEQAEQARASMVQRNAQAQIEEASGKFEFFEDLRQDMADLLEMSAKRGQRMTMEQAYSRAVAISPDHQKIVSQREAAKAAASATAQTQRSKAAASSVRSAPAVAPPRPKGEMSLREDIEEAMRELQGRA